MQRMPIGKIDVAVAISLSAAVVALAALATASFVFWQVRDIGRRGQLSAGIESLARLGGEWNAPTMLNLRSAAAAGLQSGHTTTDLDEVRSFFEELQILLDRGGVDEELAALRFYWPLANYWSACHGHTRTGPYATAAPWDDIGPLVTRLTTIEARRRKRDVGTLLPTPDDVQQFLADEQAENECADDSDTRKTPL